jgi:transcription initiation factor TFIIIB Brf1 subunit/transcription initiation factor TFIIB
LPGTQLNTFVGGKDKRLQRVHQWNNLTPKERNMHQVYREFEQIGHTHRLGKAVVNAATQLYSRLYTEMENKNCGVKRCNVRQGLKAACLYFTCKQLNTPRERKEIAEMMGNTTRIVTKGCNSFLDIMGGDFIRMEPFTPRDFVERFCLLLGISYPMQRRLEVIVEYVSTLESLVDNTPTSVTSACIYFLSREYNLKISKETIHKTCGSSQIIITKTFSKIVPHASEIQELLKSYDRSP